MKATWLLTALAASLSAATVKAEIQVERYQVEIAAENRVPYQGAFKNLFPQGFAPGLGSGLAFKGKHADGSLSFYALTDRGPNTDAPKLQQGQGKAATKVFPSPDFVPTFMEVRIQGQQALASAPRALQDENGPISGLPLPIGVIGSTNEVALDELLKPIAVQQSNGLDTEGMVSDGQGGFWICDEYGPFIAQINAEGRILRKFGPEAATGEQGVAGGLPNLLKWRQPNRGFEGVAMTPAGKVYAVVQSTLNIEGNTRDSAQFIRIVELDPATGATRMFAYPHDISAYKRSRDAKIGDLVALDNQRFLLIEQGKGADKNMRNLIYLVDLSEATDLSNLQIEGKELEYASAEQLAAAGIKMANKSLKADLRALGWQVEKAEGLALVDERTLAVASDNDFGVGIQVQQAAKGGEDIEDYLTDGEGQLWLEGQPVQARLALQPLKGEDAHSMLWLLKLDQPLL